MELSFENPSETLELLTSENIDYQGINDFAKELATQIPENHTNKEGRKFHALTQCILECYKRINSYNSTKWASSDKVPPETFNVEDLITFKRINGKGEICEYSMLNLEKVDLSNESEWADEYKVVKKKTKKTTRSTDTSTLTALPLNRGESQEDNKDYQKVLSLLMNGENVFLTGYAGTGKSYILNKLKEKLKKNLTITSTTGIAAVNVKGQTLHSWAGVGLCKNPVHKTIEKIYSRPSVVKQIRSCKILAIDEISMLNTETFEYVDEVLKVIRESFSPFGGIQVLFIGDFYQLPPVEGVGVNIGEYSLFDEDTFTDTFTHRYCFDSPLWEDFKLKNIVLKQNYRQSEKDFIRALSDMRTNSLTEEDTELLKSRETYLDTFETNMLHIFSTNLEADKYNMAKFNMIDEPVKVFEAQDGVYRGAKAVYSGFTENEKYILEIFGKNCRAEKEIALKLGAKVMLLVNLDFNRGLINGSCGDIQNFNEDTITVKFDNGEVADIPRHRFEYYYHDKLTAERTQFPLKLAYGITIHKSQGMTLDKLVVDCSRIFEKGQAYVAMSRVKTLNGLYLKNFSKDKVMVDDHVAEFYSNLKETGDVMPVSQLEFKLD